MPDAFGEPDDHFFRIRPDINVRLRVCFDDEPPAALRDFEGDIAFVRVQIQRDADGQPSRISRKIVFGPWGRA